MIDTKPARLTAADADRARKEHQVAIRRAGDALARLTRAQTAYRDTVRALSAVELRAHAASVGLKGFSKGSKHDVLIALGVVERPFADA